MAARVPFRGRTTCSCMAEWLPEYEKALIRADIIKRSVDIYQLIGNAAASAGYHKSGATADLKQSSTTALRIARNMGAAGFGRTKADGMTPHQHLVLKGCPHLTAGAKAQVPELERGGDGLVGSRKDRGPRTGIKWPLRTWKEGIAWAKGNTEPEKPPVITPESLVYIVTADPFLWGLAKPGSGNDRKVERPEGSHLTSQASAKLANGERWVQGTDGWWSSAAYLTPTSSVPDPTEPADSFEFRLSALNRNARYWREGGLKPYSQRVQGLAAVSALYRSSVDIGCEAGGYDDGAAYNKARGWGGRRVIDDKPKSGDSFVLHGGAVPVTTTVDADSDKRKFVATGQFETVGTRNRWATWAVLEDKTTGIRVLTSGTHLEFEPKGKNPAKHWGNKRRFDQLDVAMTKLEPIAKKYNVSAIVIGGDMNGLKSDPWDGPGKAATKHGYTEKASGRIDRIFVKGVNGGHIEIKELTAIKAHPATDLNHYLIGVLLNVQK